MKSILPMMPGPIPTTPGPALIEDSRAVVLPPLAVRESSYLQINPSGSVGGFAPLGAMSFTDDDYLTRSVCTIYTGCHNIESRLRTLLVCELGGGFGC